MTGFLQTPVADQGARHRNMEAAEWREKREEAGHVPRNGLKLGEAH